MWHEDTLVAQIHDPARPAARSESRPTGVAIPAADVHAKPEAGNTSEIWPPPGQRLAGFHALGNRSRVHGHRDSGQLHGLSIRELLRTRNLGPVTVAELGDLLRRAEAGEFTFSRRELASKTPADLLRLIDTLVSQLPERRRTVLTLYFGATAQGPQTLRQIGLRYGITGSRVGQQLTRAIRWMLRQGNPRLLALLGLVDRAWARSQAPLRPELVSTWQDPASPFRYCPEFYVWLIPRLRLEAELPCGEPSAMDRASANHA